WTFWTIWTISAQEGAASARRSTPGKRPVPLTRFWTIWTIWTVSCAEGCQSAALQHTRRAPCAVLDDLYGFLRGGLPERGALPQHTPLSTAAPLLRRNRPNRPNRPKRPTNCANWRGTVYPYRAEIVQIVQNGQARGPSGRITAALFRP